MHVDNPRPLSRRDKESSIHCFLNVPLLRARIAASSVPHGFSSSSTQYSIFSSPQLAKNPADYTIATSTSPFRVILASHTLLILLIRTPDSPMPVNHLLHRQTQPKFSTMPILPRFIIFPFPRRRLQLQQLCQMPGLPRARFLGAVV
jgi:hypothetical protein